MKSVLYIDFRYLPLWCCDTLKDFFLQSIQHLKLRSLLPRCSLGGAVPCVTPNPTWIHLRSQQSPEVQELSWPLCDHMKAQYHLGRIWENHQKCHNCVEHRVTTRNKKVSHLLHWWFRNIFVTWEREWIAGWPLLMMFYARDWSKQLVDSFGYLYQFDISLISKFFTILIWNFAWLGMFLLPSYILLAYHKCQKMHTVSDSYHWYHLGMCYIITCLSFLYSSHRISFQKGWHFAWCSCR